MKIIRLIYEEQYEISKLKIGYSLWIKFIKRVEGIQKADLGKCKNACEILTKIGNFDSQYYSC